MKLSTTTLSALLAGLAMAQSTFWVNMVFYPTTHTKAADLKQACKLDDASGTCYEFAKVDGKDSRTPNEPVPCLEDSVSSHHQQNKQSNNLIVFTAMQGA
ncbi:hypothetical protein IAQ61_009887 [Plenodomus lingam]|uniref:uncharacterized protein n=1 Tax=Leptosphaeria maculans TaxID=5022 RepID=UPI003318BC3A|nr:hypothetical protein IAQ61_009887 [Plenodomus lingam]